MQFLGCDWFAPSKVSIAAAKSKIATTSAKQNGVTL
jgi:hypothetical protein